MKYLLSTIFLISLIYFIPDRQITISKAQMMIDKHAETIQAVMLKESEGKENARNENDGGSLSLGCLQFKEKTFIEKVKKFGLFVGADDADIQNLWADCWSQKLVMSLMLETEEKPLCHWQNTSREVRNYKCKGE